MELEIRGESESIHFGATGIDEITQNIRTILTTIQGAVPLDRSFGLDIEGVDKTPEVAEALLSSEIMEKVEMLEPRVEVQEVSFDGNIDGQFISIVRVQIREDDENE